MMDTLGTFPIYHSVLQCGHINQSTLAPLRIATHSIWMTSAALSPFSVSHTSGYPKSRGFAKHCFATVHPIKTSIKVSSAPETSSIALIVFATQLLIVLLASYVTKSSLNNSLDPLGLTSTVKEWHPLLLLVATYQKLCH